jgi:hypothetical protein
MRKHIRIISIVSSFLALIALSAGLALHSVRADDEDFEVVDHQTLLSGGEIDSTGGAVGPSSSVTGVGQPPRVGPNTRVNDLQQGFPNGLFGRSETSITSTDDGQLIVAGFNDAQGFCGAPFGTACTPQTPPGLSGYAFSSDGGVTWTDGGGPPVVNHVFTRGDPWLDRGGVDNATFYYANLAVHDVTGASLGVSVHRGRFSGSSFSWNDVHTFNAPNPNDFYDKEAIAMAKDGSGAGYVSLTNFIELPCPAFPNTAGAFGQIEVWRTHDGGNTWQGPTIVSTDMTNANPADPNCGNTGVLQQSSVPSIGPNGEVYVTWQMGPTFSGPGGSTTSTNAKIVVARSLDGGVTFGAPTTVAGINSLRNDTPVGYNRDRINDHPRIAVAASGRNRGRVYVTYYSAVAPTTAGAISPCPAPLVGLRCREQRLTSSQAFVKFSDDMGATWSSAIPIAPAVPATGVKRFWPVVTVEPGGNVDVVYYESQETLTASNPICTINVGGTLRRRGPANSLVNTFWAQSTDGGATFSAPLMVSTATTNWCTTLSNIRPNFGDYIGSASAGNRTLASWADGRNGVPDTFYAAILGAGKS